MSEGVPEDAEAVIIYAPTLDISAEEAETLKTYIKGGGDIVLITGYEVNVGASMPNLSSVCEMMGMKSEDGLVLEGSQSNYYNNPLYLYPIIGSNGPTSPVSLLDSSNIGVLMPYSHGISAIEGAEGVTVTPVLSTTTSAYLKKTVDENTTVAKADGDVEGQFMVAAASTYSDDAENADGGRIGLVLEHLRDRRFRGSDDEGQFAALYRNAPLDVVKDRVDLDNRKERVNHLPHRYIADGFRLEMDSLHRCSGYTDSCRICGLGCPPPQVTGRARLF